MSPRSPVCRGRACHQRDASVQRLGDQRGQVAGVAVEDFPGTGGALSGSQADALGGQGRPASLVFHADAVPAQVHRLDDGGGDAGHRVADVLADLGVGGDQVPGDGRQHLARMLHRRRGVPAASLLPRAHLPSHEHVPPRRRAAVRRGSPGQRWSRSGPGLRTCPPRASRSPQVLDGPAVADPTRQRRWSTRRCGHGTGTHVHYPLRRREPVAANAAAIRDPCAAPTPTPRAPPRRPPGPTTRPASAASRPENRYRRAATSTPGRHRARSPRRPPPLRRCSPGTTSRHR
jgi:hypothetical protein